MKILTYNNPVVSVVAVIIVGLFVGMKIYKEKVSTKYRESIETVSAKMVAGSAIAEDACNLTRSDWDNTIFKKNDSSTNKYTRQNNGTGDFYADFNDAIVPKTNSFSVRFARFCQVVVRRWISFLDLMHRLFSDNWKLALSKCSATGIN